MKSPSNAKPLTEMTAEELAKETAEFDEEFVAEAFQTPPPAARARLQKAKRKRGRPRVGEGATVISVSVEKKLLRRANRLARKLKVSRARLISLGLETILAAHEKTR